MTQLFRKNYILFVFYFVENQREIFISILLHWIVLSTGLNGHHFLISKRQGLSRTGPTQCKAERMDA